MEGGGWGKLTGKLIAVWIPVFHLLHAHTLMPLQKFVIHISPPLFLNDAPLSESL